MGFKQGDSRWGNKPLGRSAYNMKGSGCLVTAVADSLNRHLYPTDPGKLVDWLNVNKGFQDPKGFLIFDAIRRFTKNKIKLVEGDRVRKINNLIEVNWKLSNGRYTKHWLEKLTIPAPPGIKGEYVVDPTDGQGKSLTQTKWKATGRRLSLIY